MGIYAVCFLVAIAVLAGTAQSQEIIDLYSNIESADVSIRGDVSGYTLRLELITGGDVLQNRNLLLDGPGTWIVRWSGFEAEKGSYDVCASLLKNGAVVSRKCNNFFYGGNTPIRFDVRDFYADSKGMHLSISASDPTIVDIYYMLITGNKAIYVTRDEAVAIAGGYSTPVEKDYAWRQILRDNQEYTGRVKIVELNHNQTRSFMNSFRAREDALITETYQDETGASATVVGNSRVPFEGKLSFILSQDGRVLNVTDKKTPVLLTADDETVEISWNKTLEPGVYQLRTILMGKDGNVKDLEENIIEAEPIARPANTTETQNKSPLEPGSTAVALIAIALFKRWRR